MIAILKKELRSALREKTGWLLLLSMPALLFVFGFFNVSVENRWDGTPISACETGRKLLAVAVYTQVFGLFLLLPPLTAVGLVREGERKTLETLMTTPRGSVELGLAKLLAPVVLAIGSVLLTLPVQMALPLIGGVRPWEPLAGAWVAFLTALVAASLGLAAGALARSAAGAVIVSVIGSGGMLLSSCWTLGRTVTLPLDAATPIGMAVAISGGDGIRVHGFDLPLLLPSALLLPLVAACLFFASLPYLSSPYRRRALPVRACGTAALAAFALLLAASTSRDSVTSHADLLSGLSILACILAPLLLVLERIDTAGFMSSLAGSAEARATAAGSVFRRLLASRLGLALLPMAALLAGSVSMGVWALERGSKAEPLMSVWCLAFGYVLSWAFYCVAASNLVPQGNYRWLRAIGLALPPVALIALDIFLRGGDGPKGLFFSPIGALSKLSDILRSPPTASAQDLGSAVLVMALLSAALCWVASMMHSRRASRATF